MVFLQVLAFVSCPRSIAAWSYSWVWALALWSLAVLLEALKHRRMRCVIKDVLDVAEDAKMYVPASVSCWFVVSILGLRCSTNSVLYHGLAWNSKLGHLSVYQWLLPVSESPIFCFIFLLVFFLLHFHLCHCGAICLLGGEDPFLTTCTHNNAKFILTENSYMQRKFA